MITQKDKLLLKKKIISARAVLMRKNAFFALLLMHMRYVAVPGMNQLSTNGETIFFSPELMKKYSMNELTALLCHQIMHIIEGDIWRAPSLKGDEFHYRRDLVVNEELRACGIGTYYVYMRAIPDKPMVRHGLIEIEHRRMVDTDEFWDYDLFNVENGVVILEAPYDMRSSYSEHSKVSDSKSEEDDTEDEEDGSRSAERSQIRVMWNNLMQQYSDAGDVPKCVERSYEEKIRGKLDWRKLLAEFVQEETFDYSFCPPDRRFDNCDFFLPDFNEKSFVVKNVIFMVDTSGSISDRDLEVVFAEIKHAIDLFDGNLNGFLGFFDAEVVEPQPFTNVEDIANIIPYGGGGTDFRPIFKYIAENCSSQLPSCVVIYTDGFGDFPRKRDTLGVPVLWLINNDEVTPPFGKVARVLSI